MYKSSFPFSFSFLHILLANLSDTMIGVILSLQYGIMSLLSPIYGVIADNLEMKYPNYGRASFLATSVAVGCVCVLLHNVIEKQQQPHFNNDEGQHRLVRLLVDNGDDIHGDDLSSTSVSFNDDGDYDDDESKYTATILHIIVQCVYACCLGVMFPVIDGMTLDYLKKNASASVMASSSTNSSNIKQDGITVDYDDNEESPSNSSSSMDYGKERLFGGISWGIANVALGVALNTWDYNVAYYVGDVLISIIALCTIYYYVRGQKCQQIQSRQEEVIPEESPSQEEQISSTLAAAATTTTASLNNTDTKDWIYQYNNPTKLLSNSENEYFEKNDNNESEWIPLIAPAPKITATATSIRSSSSSASSSSSLDEEATTSDDHKETCQHNIQYYCSLVMKVIGTKYGAAFLLAYVLLASGLSIVENLVFLFFEQLTNGNTTICGLTVACTVLFEIPVFQISPKLLRKYGVGILLLAANVAFIIRIIGYTLIPEGHIVWLFLLESLHGVTYACSQAAAVEYVDSRMPIGKEASGQGIVNLARGTGSVLGLFLGGILQDTYGPRTMYRIFAMTVTTGTLLFGYVHVTDASSTTAATSKETTTTSTSTDVPIGSDTNKIKHGSKGYGAI